MTLEDQARGELVSAFGPGAEPVTGMAPGRVTLVGEHVDYVGGLILAMAIDRQVHVVARESTDGRWRVSSRGRRAERDSPEPRGDIADRVLAPAVVLGGVPALEVVVASSLPESAGLSSSAAVACAAMVAMLRLTGRTLSPSEAVDVALRAERDVVGVPCGELDQRTIIENRSGSAVLLDCAAHSTRVVAWPWDDVVIVVADSGEKHDVGSGEYAKRRAAAEAVLDIIGVDSSQQMTELWREVPGDLIPTARHIAAETIRAAGAASALRSGAAPLLGALMGQSHASLRDDYRVSTARLDAMVAAADAVPGCHGSRLVGAGFGGSAIALCEQSAAPAVAEALVGAADHQGEAWVVSPAPGLIETAADVVAS